MDLQHFQDSQVKDFQANPENKFDNIQAKNDLNRSSAAQFPGQEISMLEYRHMKAENENDPRTEKSAAKSEQISNKILRKHSSKEQVQCVVQYNINDEEENNQNIKEQMKLMQEPSQCQSEKEISYQKKQQEENTIFSAKSKPKYVQKIENIQECKQLQRDEKFENKKEQRSLSYQKEDFTTKYQKLPCSFCDKPQTLQEMDRHHYDCSMAFNCRNCHDFFPIAFMNEHNQVCKRKRQNFRRQQNANTNINAFRNNGRICSEEDYATEQQLRFLREHQEIPLQLLLEHLRAQKQKKKQKKQRTNNIFGQYMPHRRSFQTQYRKDIPLQTQYRSYRHFQAQLQQHSFSNRVNKFNFLQNNRRPQNNLGTQRKQKNIQGLKDYQINNLLTDRYSKGQQEEVDICTICTNEKEEGETIIRLPCFHTFHKECIIPWVKVKSLCPTCKHDVKSK